MINSSTIDGEFTEGAITVGSTPGSIEINQGIIKGEIANMNTSLTFNSGSVATITSLISVRLSGSVQIYGGISCEVILTSAPQYKLKFYLIQGNIAASGGNGFVLAEKYLSMFESINPAYRLVWKNNQIFYEKIGGDTPSVAETEDDLQKMLDAAASSSESNPIRIPIKNVTLTKPLVVEDKYITLSGGSLTSSKNTALITVKKGGLVFDNISVSASWSTSGKFILVTGNGTLIIRSTATISSSSKDLNLIYIEAGSTLKNDGIITGCISSSGILYLNSGTIHGQVTSSGLFYLSGTVKIDTGVYLPRSALIVMTSAPKYSLQILTDGKSSTVVVKGGSGFVLSQSYLNMFVCVTENWLFTWSNNQITVVEKQSASFQVTWNTLTGVTVKPESGYSASSIAKGGDFKFTIACPVGEKAVVKMGTTVVTPDVLYYILWRAGEGATLVPESGYDENAVEEGDNFKFHIVLDALHRDCDVQVRVDGAILSPDAWGVYTLSNIRSDKEIEITLSGVFSVTFVKPKEDIKMVAETGYNPDRVLAGSSFKFHLISQYKADQLQVRANGKLLIPTNSVYTIYDMNVSLRPSAFQLKDSDLK